MTTNAIKPPISLLGTLTSAEDIEFWNEDDGSGDPWLGQAYKWKVSIDFQQIQMHSFHESQAYMQYTVMDVKPGFWMADLTSGKAVKIRSIDPSTWDMKLVCEVEDIDRFNTFCDYSQMGIGRPSEFTSVVIFEVGRDGLPVFGPVSQYSEAFGVNTAWTADVLSNFRFRNLYRDVWRVYQPNHTFQIDDVVYLGADGQYKLASSDKAAANRIIGTVSTINTPGVNWFTIKPLASITPNIDPPLPGSPGDIIFVDPQNPRKNDKC